MATNSAGTTAAEIVRPAARPIQNCAQCRKRKIKCNKTYPCAPCLLRGEGDLCREVEKNAVGRNSPESMDTVIHRITVLEDTVQKLVKMIPNAVSNGEIQIRSPIHTAKALSSSTGGGQAHATASSTPISGPSSRTIPPNVTEVAAKSSTIRSLYGTNTKEEEVAMMLEDFAMGHRVNRARATQDMEGDAESGASPSGYDDRRDSMPYMMGESHPLAMIVDPNVNVWLRAISLLPSVGRCRDLIDFYFARLEWSIKVLHRPTFLFHSDILLKYLNTLHSSTNTNTSTPSSQIIPDPSIPPPGVNLPFLGIFLMVLSLGFHLIDLPVCEQLGYTLYEANAMAKKLYTAVQACLFYGDFLGSHSLEHLQCIILMGVYQQNLDEADSHWALLGSAIKIAQNLGLSRLGSESDDRRYSEHWRSAVKRETARRIWWTLIMDDWSHAAAHNGTYCIHPSQNYTGLPANVNDEDLVDGKKVESRPWSEYTEMSFVYCRLRFVIIYREIVDNMQHPTGGYEFILDMDTKLVHCLQEFLPIFKKGSSSDGRNRDQGNESSSSSSSAVMYDPDGRARKRQKMDRSAMPSPSAAAASASSSYVSVKDLEHGMILLIGETRRLRLHRPYLFRGYKDRRYTKSREQCIDSARSIMQLLKRDEMLTRMLFKSWVAMFYGFAAAVVLFIDLCHHKSDSGSDLASRRAELKEALDLFKTAEQISTVSRNAIALLEGLINAEPDLMSGSPARKGSSSSRDEKKEEAVDPFEKIVKRIIVDTSRGVASPSTSQQHFSPPMMPSPIPPQSYSPHPHGSMRPPPALVSTHPIAPVPRAGTGASGGASYQYSAVPASAAPTAAADFGHGGGGAGGGGTYVQPAPQWQFDNPFATRWDLGLFGFNAEGGGAAGQGGPGPGGGGGGGDGMGGGGAAAQGNFFPDLSDASMADLSQLLLGFGGGGPNYGV